MEIICHRINTIDSLKKISLNYGVEVDIRSLGDKLIINHEPFENGDLFEDWIKFYNHGTLILNVKEEGLERKITNVLKKYNINSYFFLDQSFPFLIKSLKEGEYNCALRFSEYESINTALNFKNRFKWVWVDMFTKLPLTYGNYVKLKENKYKICLVSPELQKNNSFDIDTIRKELAYKKILVDAVCTKLPENWE